MMMTTRESIYKIVETSKINMVSLFGVSVGFYFIKTLSGLRNFTLCLRSCKYDRINFKAESRRPYAFSFVGNKLWHIESNAFDRSIAIIPTPFFSSRAIRQSSVNLINAVGHEWPRRNPDIFSKNIGANCS